MQWLDLLIMAFTLDRVLDQPEEAVPRLLAYDPSLACPHTSGRGLAECWTHLGVPDGDSLSSSARQPSLVAVCPCLVAVCPCLPGSRGLVLLQGGYHTEVGWGSS